MRKLLAKTLLFFGKRFTRWGNKLSKPSVDELVQQVQILRNEFEQSSKEVNELTQRLSEALSTIESTKNQQREL